MFIPTPDSVIRQCAVPTYMCAPHDLETMRLFTLASTASQPGLTHTTPTHARVASCRVWEKEAETRPGLCGGGEVLRRDAGTVS